MRAREPLPLHPPPRDSHEHLQSSLCQPEQQHDPPAAPATPPSPLAVIAPTSSSRPPFRPSLAHQRLRQSTHHDFDTPTARPGDVRVPRRRRLERPHLPPRHPHHPAPDVQQGRSPSGQRRLQLDLGGAQDDLPHRGPRRLLLGPRTRLALDAPLAVHLLPVLLGPPRPVPGAQGPQDDVGAGQQGQERQAARPERRRGARDRVPRRRRRQGRRLAALDDHGARADVERAAAGRRRRQGGRQAAGRGLRQRR